MPNNNLKVVFMGTPDFAVPTLESLYNSGFDISLVISQEDKPKGRGKKLQPTPVKEKALELGLQVFQPKKINERESIDKIKEINPDFIVVVAYGQILKSEILNIPQYGCLNVHASILPKLRGAAPINWAIINGDNETGISIMKMEEGLDSGDTILIQSTPIKAEDDVDTIHDRLSKMGGELIVKAMNDIVENKAIFTPQNHEISTYAPMINKELGRINWCSNGVDIVNKVRGLKSWPNAFSYYKEDMVKIHKVDFLDKRVNVVCGTIVSVDKNGINVSVNDGQIIIKELQFPGKKVLTVAQYLAGNTLEVGTLLK